MSDITLSKAVRSNLLNLQNLQVLRETTNAAGQVVRQVQDQTGAVIEYTLDSAGNIISTRVVRQAPQGVR